MTTEPLYPRMAAQHPRFDQTTLPSIPRGFEDESYANDACPFFLHRGLWLELQIDYLKDEDREEQMEGAPRFVLNQWVMGPHGWEPDDKMLAESDDWDEIEAVIHNEFRTSLAEGRLPYWDLGAELEFSNGQQATVAALDPADPKRAVLKINDSDGYMAAETDADLYLEGSWVDLYEAGEPFATAADALAYLASVDATEGN